MLKTQNHVALWQHWLVHWLPHWRCVILQNSKILCDFISTLIGSQIYHLWVIFIHSNSLFSTVKKLKLIFNFLEHTLSLSKKPPLMKTHPEVWGLEADGGGRGGGWAGGGSVHWGGKSLHGILPGPSPALPRTTVFADSFLSRDFHWKSSAWKLIEINFG